MRVILRLNYSTLEHLSRLFTALYERYPRGWLWFCNAEKREDDPRLILSVQPYCMTQADRDFLDSLREQHLLSLWYTDF